MLKLKWASYAAMAIFFALVATKGALAQPEESQTVNSEPGRDQVPAPTEPLPEAHNPAPLPEPNAMEASPSAAPADVSQSPPQRCPSDETGCNVQNAGSRIQDRMNEGAKKVLRNDNPEGRVDEVKKALKYCLDCGMDAIKGGVDSLSLDGNSSSGANTKK